MFLRENRHQRVSGKTVTYLHARSVSDAQDAEIA
jgi:hypothetical protein